MRTLSSLELAATVGGDRSTTTVRVGLLRAQASESDHDACAAAMRRAAARRFPPTGVFPFAPDLNAVARQRLGDLYIRQYCERRRR